MKIAFITTKPVRLESGTEVRNYYLLKALLESKKVTSIHLLYINSDISKEEIGLQDPKLQIELFPLPKRTFSSSLRSYFQGHIPYHDHLRNNWYTSEVLKIIQQSDCIFLSELDSYVATQVALRRLKAKKKVVIDCHNVDYVRFASEVLAGSITKKIFGSMLVPSFKRIETEALQNVSLVTCCSVPDKQALQKLSDRANISVIPNGVHLTEQSGSKMLTHSHSAPMILFVGLLSFGPNDDGIRYYLEQIHPLVLAKHPLAKFVIIGKNAPDWLVTRSKSDKSIVLKGFVPQLDSYLAHADVCVCPLRYGSGTRLKLLEYMGAKRPVVSTSIGCEGLDVTDRKNILIADTPERFEMAISEILGNKSLSNQLSIGGRELVEKKYNWDSIGRALLALL